MNKAKNAQSSSNLPQPVYGVNDNLGISDQTRTTTSNSSQFQVNTNNDKTIIPSTISSATKVQNDDHQDIGPLQIADDKDLIEQEWVDKAKAIIEKTKEDPHLQNQELSEVKADYIKKRYNKDIDVAKDKQ